MVRLHLPEQVEVDRGDFQPRATRPGRSRRSRATDQDTPRR
jgi:hypothetical protein